MQTRSTGFLNCKNLGACSLVSLFLFLIQVKLSTKPLKWIGTFIFHRKKEPKVSAGIPCDVGAQAQPCVEGVINYTSYTRRAVWNHIMFFEVCVFLYFKISSHLLQLFRRILQCLSAPEISRWIRNLPQLSIAIGGVSRRWLNFHMRVNF